VTAHAVTPFLYIAVVPRVALLIGECPAADRSWCGC